MATIADELAALPSGARFYRADLHIHSFGASHDVKDATMTPQGIVDTAIAEGLAVIAVTDHNEIFNVQATIDAAKGKSLLVIPGVELSTPEGHLLVYFEDFVALNTFHGKLDLAGRSTSESRCQTSLLECLNRVHSGHGFGVLAHVDAPGGLEKKLSGNPPHKSDILCHQGLVAIELKSAQSTISFSDLDDDPERQNIGRKRIQVLSLGSKQYLARVVSSDSHSLAALGKNAQGQKRLTRVKMDTPSFHGLRIALQDSDARIRLEEEVPQSVAHIMGMKMSGGLLGGVFIHFSRNLNCIIGGRGAGKSTAFESVRCLAPGQSGSKLIDCDIWPEALSVVWSDEVGQQTTIQRVINDTCKNLTNPDSGLSVFPIESYGQNETAQASVHAQTNPAILLKYLDQFIDLEQPKQDDQRIRTELLENQTNIEKADQEVARIPDFKKRLATVQQQLKALESAKAKEVVALERKIAEERALRETLEQQVANLNTQIKKSSLSSILNAVETSAKPEDMKVGGAELKEILELAAQLHLSTDAAEAQLLKNAQAFQSEVKRLLIQWKAQEQAVLDQIDAIRKDLFAQGIQLDLPYIKKLATDEATYKETLRSLVAWEDKLKELNRTRRALLVQRQAVRSRISSRRSAYATKANKSLKQALSDLNVSIKFVESAYSTEGQEIVQQAAQWRTSQVPRAALIVEQVTPPKLLDAIRTSDPTSLQQVATADHAKVFSKSEAQDLLRSLAPRSVVFRLERCQVDDMPRITVTKTNMVGTKVEVTSRDFTRLSLGQQQSILLTLMLSSDSKAPLIIDQPEDNLDSEFIFHSLVPVLRAAKERRQIIVVTHNANIAVLGDAEQIIALKSTNDRSSIVASGSIDDPTTKDMVCRILEGAVEAFQRRAKTYGLVK